MSGLLSIHRRAESAAAPAPPPPEVPVTEFGEAAGASARLMRDEQYIVQQTRIDAHYAELAEQLVRLGASRDDLFRLGTSAGEAMMAASLYGADGGPPIPTSQVNRDAIWREAARLRQSNPAAFAELENDRAAYEARVAGRSGGRQRDQSTVSRATGFSAQAGVFLGGAGGAIIDPVNITTLPLGGFQRSIWRTMLINGAINGGVELAQQPSVSATRAVMGEEHTAADAATRVGFAFGGGMILSGALKGAVDYGPGAVRQVRGLTDQVTAAVAQRMYAMLPQDLQLRYATLGDVPDVVLADVLERFRGPDLTPDERGAIALTRRMADIDAANPFVRNMAGDQAHANEMMTAMERILATVPPSTPLRPRVGAAGGGGVAAPRPPAAPPAPTTGTAADQVMAMFRRNESGGNDSARATTSTARGRYGMIRSTFKYLYRRRFAANDGAAERAWQTRWNDGDLQDTLMRDLLGDHSRYLRQYGQPETPGNMYLMHFLGPGDARRIFNADPAARVTDVLPAPVVNANSFLRRMSVSDLRDWVNRKMGDAPGAGQGSVTLGRVADGSADEADLALQAELDAIAARQAELDDEAARMLAGEDGAPPSIDVFTPSRADDFADVELPTVAAGRGDDGDLGDALADGPTPPRMGDEGATAAPEPFIPRRYRAETLDGLRQLVTGTRERVSDVPALAARLNASEAEVQAALAELAVQKVLIQRIRRVKGKDGAPDTLATSYQRVPRDTRDYAQAVIARAGGIRDEVSGRGGAAHDIATRLQRRDGKGSAFIPGVGPLVRRIDDPRALTLDEVGELLHEGGYLFSREAGNERGRPTVSEVLDYLEEGMTNPKGQVREADIADFTLAAERDAAPLLSPEAERAWLWGEESGRPVGIAEAEEMGDIIAAAAARGEPMTEGQAYAGMVNQRMVDDALDLWDELGDDADTLARIADIADEAAGGQAGRSAADGSDPRAGEADAGAGRAFEDDEWRGWEPADDGWRATEPLERDGPWRDTAETKGWDDPDGAQAREQADSLAHDARVAAKGDDVMVANEDGELTPAFERELERATAAAQALEAEGKVPLFHATSGPWKSENPNGMGMVFHADDLMMAARYAGAGGGRRAVGNAGRIIVRELPADAKIIDITSREGVDELAQLPLAGRLSGVILRDAKKATETGDLAVVNNSFWTITKRASANDAVEIKTFIVDELRRRGYDGIKFGDDRHDSFALFDRANEPSPSRDPADMFGGATRDEARQALERRGDGGLSNGAPQKPAGSDGGLFDSGTGKQVEFRLDVDGEARALPDILDDLDAEAAAIKAMRDCL